jgi:hypothetical protein
MAATMHDLRVSLRDKMKTISELELKINELKAELFRKDSQIYEYEIQLKSKDETINSKDKIIKEKDLIISKLENKLKNNDNIQLLNKTDNHIELLETKTDVVQNSMPPTIQNNTTNEQTVILALPIKKKAQIINNNQQLQQPSLNLSKTKRMAISAEPAQLNKKSKDFKTSLKEYEKSDE